MSVKDEVRAIRERQYPEVVPLTRTQKLRKSYRKEANKRYRDSAIGRERRRIKDKRNRIEHTLVSDAMKKNPELVEELKKKYFTEREDGLGSTEEI